MRYITKKDLLIISHFQGYILQGIGFVFLIPIIVAIIYGENLIIPFLVPSLIAIIIGTFCIKTLKNYNQIKLKHAMIISAISWMLVSIIGALILVLHWI